MYCGATYARNINDPAMIVIARRGKLQLKEVGLVRRVEKREMASQRSMRPEKRPLLRIRVAKAKRRPERRV
jgi:hypothetical protein